MADVLDISVSGLLAYQRALQTTSHNISNVNTEGYSRQRVELSTQVPQFSGNGYIGSGVNIESISRIFDQYVQNQVQDLTSSHGQQEILLEFSSQVDSFLADASTGLMPVIQRFFDSIQNVNDDPTSIPARQVALSEADTMVSRFNAFYSRLETLSQGVNTQLQSMVDAVNGIASEIADINKSIQQSPGQSNGQYPNDLLDRRDFLVTKLSEYVQVNTLDQADGTMSIFIGNGQSLVVGVTSQKLGLVNSEFDPNLKEIAFLSGSSSVNITKLVTGGSLGGLLSFRGRVLDEVYNDLGLVGAGLVETFNRQHKMGQDLDGSMGGDFFSVGNVEALPGTSNSGTGSISAARVSVDAMTTSDYLLQYNGGNSYSLTRLSDNTATTINTGGTSPFVSEEIDGLSFTITAGASNGDRFLIRPTRAVPGSLGGLVNDPAKLAVAAPIAAAASATNVGSATVSPGTVNSPDNRVVISFNTPPTTFDVVDSTSGATLASGLSYTSGGNISFNGWTVQVTDGGGAPAAGDSFVIDKTVTTAGSSNTGTATISAATVSAAGVDPNLTDTVTITFNNPPTTFNVTGATTGSPVVNLPYTAGQPISFNGWTLDIQGSPVAGDVFTVSANTSGVSDNRNGLLLSGLQDRKSLSNGTSSLMDAYGEMVAEVGATTSQAKISEQAQSILLREAVDKREATSGVNLDEEAANLVRFQQAYQAAAQIISTADQLFQSLINAVGR
jgi:flagellar hook-associated protein 1 FlgK